MARLVEPNARELCIECEDEGRQRHADKVIAVRDRRIPLCKDHLDELMADFAVP